VERGELNIGSFDRAIINDASSDRILNRAAELAGRFDELEVNLIAVLDLCNPDTADIKREWASISSPASRRSCLAGSSPR
jgi:hypothetical protein